MEINTNNLGPFVPIVGYAAAIVAAVWLIAKLLWTSEELWQIPLDIIPKALKGVITGILSVGLIFLWLHAKIETINLYMIMAGGFILIGVCVFVFFHPYVRKHTYIKEVPISRNKVKNVHVIGGNTITEEAKRSLKKNKIHDLQILLKGAAYNVNEIWTRDSIENVKTKITVFYLLVVTLIFLALTTVALVVQVTLTKQAATKVINRSESPGLEKK